MSKIIFQSRIQYQVKLSVISEERIMTFFRYGRISKNLTASLRKLMGDMTPADQKVNEQEQQQPKAWYQGAEDSEACGKSQACS